MTRLIIDTGNVINDGTGDTLREGADKINANFEELYSALGIINNTVSTVRSIGASNGVRVDGSYGDVNIVGVPASSVEYGVVKLGANLILNEQGAIDAPAPYVLPTATESVIGGVKVDGTTVVINNGVISAPVANYTLPVATTQVLGGVRVDGVSVFSNNGVLTSAQYTLPTASTLRLGGVKVDGTTITINNGVISGAPAYELPTATTSVLGGVKVDGTTITINNGVISGANTYTLPKATSSVLGGVKVDGTTITVNDGVISGANTYTLPTASDTVLGGVKVDNSTIVINDGVISISHAPPNLADVATSGSYADLINKPTIPSITAGGSPSNIYWDNVDGKAYIRYQDAWVDIVPATPIPTTLSAFTNDVGYLTSVGTISYLDLSNKPTIPSITAGLTPSNIYWDNVGGKAYIRYQNQWVDIVPATPIPTTLSAFTNDVGYLTSVGTISYNSLSDKPDLSGYATTSSVSTAISELVGTAPAALNTLKELADALNNDETFATTITTAIGNKANTSDLATVATSGSYTDLTNKPALFSGSYNDLTNKPSLFSGSYLDLTNKPTLFSGSYTDLTNKPAIPTVPTNISAFTNDAGYVTSVGSISYNDLTNKPTLFSGSYLDLTNTPVIPTVPTNVSAFTNDAGYLTSIGSISYNDLTNKPTLFSGSYDDLTNKPTIPSLSGYATESYVGTAISNLVDSAPTTLNTLKELATALNNDASFASSVATSLANKADTSSLATVATSGSYLDLTNKPTLFSGSYTDLTNKPTIPTVPTNVSAFTNDAGYLTSVGTISYLDLTNKPTLFSGSYLDLTNKPTLFSGSYTDLTNKPSYATVATSGSYTDLTNKPTIPTSTSDLTNGAGFITGTSPTISGPLITSGYNIQTGGNTVHGDYVLYVPLTTTTANQVLDTPGVAYWTSLKYTIEASNSVGTEVVEISLTYSGTTVYMNTTTLISTVTPFQATYDADITGGSIRLLVTPTNINTKFKILASGFRVIA